MRETADVVVVGAGIQGLSAAYHLNKIGIQNVVVVEMETIGAGSSGRSAAMLTLQRANEPSVRLAQLSYGKYMAFEDELDVDTGYRPVGFLTVCGEALARQTRDGAELRQALGVRTEILSPAGVRDLVPAVNTDDIALGVLGVDDGVIDPHMIMQGYAAAARRMGTEINEGVTAMGIQVAGGSVTGVETTHGPVATPWVVNAAGAQAAEVVRWVGLDIPIENRRRSIFVTQPFPQIPDDTPMVHDDDVEWYYRKEGPGVLMGMGTEEATTVSWSINWDFLPRVVDYALHRVPILAEAEIMRGWSGIRSLTPDGRPVIGLVDGVDGFVNLCGWGGQGVTGAPAGGQLVAEIIHTGRAESLPIEPFLLSRFAQTG